MNNDYLNDVQLLLIEASKYIDKVKLAKAIARTPYCGSNDIRDTNILMCSEDYKERIKAEHDQLLIRITKLRTMLDNYQNGTLKFTPKCSYDLLHEQLVYMEQYLRVLQQRIVIEEIE